MDFELTTIVSLLSIPVAALLAMSLNTKLLQKEDVKPFKWGYFNAGMTAGAALGFTLDFLRYTSNYYAEPGEYLVLILIVGPYCFAALFLFQRKRSGAVLATILALNPVSWMINYGYYKNRWDELESLKSQSLTAAQNPTQSVPTIASPTQQQSESRQGPQGISRTVFAPPETHLGRWANEHYTVVLLAGSVEVLEHGSGSMRFPAIVEEQNERENYIISYKDPYTLANITYGFALETSTSLLFTMDRDGYNIEVREHLKRVAD